MSTDTANAVAIKLPKFYTHDHVTWVFNAEGQFKLRNITQDDTKFTHVVVSLPPIAIHQVRDLIRKQPESNAYQQLKDWLLERYTLMPSERAAAILDLPGLGDQQPTKLFNCLELLDKGQDNHQYLLREVFWCACCRTYRHT